MPRSPEAPANPSVLRWAREEAGYSPETIEESGTWKSGTVHAWETGKKRPSLSQLDKLSNYYGRTLAFFFRSEPPSERLAIPTDFRNRPDSSLSPRLIKEIRKVDERRKIMLELGHTGRSAIETLPNPEKEFKKSIQETRTLLGISIEEQVKFANPSAALKTWINKVEEAGVIIFQMSRIGLDECRGFSSFDEKIPIIVLNGSDKPEARIFTLFHELCHILTRSDGICLFSNQDNIETICNKFAAKFLMPDEHFQSNLSDPVKGSTSNLVKKLANKYSVSQESTAVRLKEVGHITKSELAKIRNSIRKNLEEEELKNQKKPSRGANTHIRDLGKKYPKIVLEALHKDQITLTDAAYYLNSKVQTLQKIEARL